MSFDGSLTSYLWLAAFVCVASAIATMVFVNGSGAGRKIDRKLPRLYESDDAEFRRSLSSLLGPALVEGNAVQTLVNGDAIFADMLAAIRRARHTITFETYIYWSGDVGMQFVQALIERASAGVKIHVLLDWVGSIKMADELLERLRVAGIELERFHEPRFKTLGQLNNRTHRKLLVVDGRVGFTGGVGIADQWRGNARNPDEWRDTHFRVEGPVVAQMQAVFLDNWLRVTGRVLHGEAYFPALERQGTCTSQMFSSSPSGGSEGMQLMYLLAITAARRSIDLANAYFVPDELTTQTLIDAAHRGVRVRVILPCGKIDSEAVRRASRGTWGPMLQAGIEIAEFQPTMFHVKSLVVDGHFSSVGSTNFDDRSFRLNDEANLNVLDAVFGARQLQIFEDDWGHSRPVSLAQWARRHWTERVLERLALLLRTQL